MEQLSLELLVSSRLMTFSALGGVPQLHKTSVGLARTIYIRCIYGNFGREITKYTVKYGVYIQFWPTQNKCMFMCHQGWPEPYIQCVHGVFGRKVTKYTVVYSVYVRFWPPLGLMCRAHARYNGPQSIMCACMGVFMHTLLNLCA